MIIGINASFARKPNTGIGQVTLNFLKELSHQKSKHKFILYSEEKLPNNLKLSKNFRKKIFLPFWKRDDLIRKIWWEKYLLPKKIREDKCDIFLSLYQCPTVVAVKHIMLVHDIIPKLFPEYLNNSRKRTYWKLTEKGIQKADKIITISKRTEKDLIQHLEIPAKKIAVNHIDIDEIYKQEVSTEASRKILKKYNLQAGYIYSGGGLEVRKNIESVIRAYNFLLQKNEQTMLIKKIPPLVISGKLMPQLAPLVTDVEKVIKDLNLTKKVKLLNFVPQEHLPAIYHNALVFLYPSKYEGFGLPVLEAMNQGAPVITSKTSSLPEVGGDSVLYCDPNDYKDLAMVLKNLLVHNELRKNLSRRAKERAQKFSWKEFVKSFLNKNGH